LQLLNGLVRTFVYNFLVVSFSSGLLLIGLSKLLGVGSYDAWWAPGLVFQVAGAAIWW
jgi:hypothetical protein